MKRLLRRLWCWLWHDHDLAPTWVNDGYEYLRRQRGTIKF